MTLDDMLKEIEARADAASNMRSDDFGHDTQALLVAESDKLQEIAGTDVPKLLAMLRLAIEQRDTAYTCSWDKDLGSMIADDDLALLAVGRGE